MDPEADLERVLKADPETNPDPHLVSVVVIVRSVISVGNIREKNNKKSAK
jgi:hypothetical protein